MNAIHHTLASLPALLPIIRILWQRITSRILSKP